MKEYIKMPTWIAISEIESDIVRNFLENAKYTDEYKIDLEYLRQYYKTNENIFLNLICELSLRGFEFFSIKPNNVLPQYKYAEKEEYILSDDRSDKYMNLDFEKFRIGNFISRFDVKNDAFFNYIPLNGFKAVNPHLSIEDIKEEFINSGFTIYNNATVCTQKNIPIYIDKAEETYGTENISEESLALFKIDKIFSGEKYRLFRSYCKLSSISSIEDIQNIHIEEFSTIRGVGVGKVEAIKRKIEDIRNNKDLYIEDKEIENKDEKLINLDFKYIEQFTIQKMFADRKYELFKNFCEHNDISHIGDIKICHLEEFSKLKGIGAYKVDRVKNKIDEIKTIIMEKADFFDDGVISIKKDLYKRIKDLSIYDIVNIFEKNYSGNNYLINEIQGKKLKEIIKEKDIETIGDIIIYLNCLDSPKYIMSKAINSLDERQLHIFRSRLGEGLTLQETAEGQGITRERVRQLEQKIIYKIINILHKNNFLESIKISSQGKTYLDKEEIAEILGEYSIYFINLISQGNIKDLLYYEALDIVYFYEFEFNINNLKDFISTLPDMFLLDDYIEDIENMLGKSYNDSLDIEKIEKLLVHYGYSQYGKYFSRNKLSISDILELLFRDHIKQPLKFDCNEVELVKSMCKKIFEYELDGNKRSIESRVRDIEDVILVDKMTFCHINHIYYDESMIDIVESYIDTEFKTRTEINIEELFLKFKDLCNKNNIKEKIALYSLIRYNLGDKYKIGQGNTLNIFRGDITTKYSREDRVIMFLKERNGSALRKDIMDQLKWKQFKLENAVAKSDKLLIWGSDKIILIDNLNINEKVKCNFRSILDANMKEGFTTSSIILKKSLFNPELSEFIKVNNIDENAKLAAIIKKMFKDIRGHINWLYKEDSQYKSLEDVIVNKFTEITSRDEIKEYIISYGYKDMMAANLVSNLIQDRKYLEISQDEIIPYSKLNFSKEIISSVVDEVWIEIEDKEYISLSEMRGYRKKLPDIEYRWNPNLIKSVVEGNGFRAINKIYRDYRYDKVIVVKEESKINTFEDLIYHILKNEYKGNLHQVKVYDYLVSVGILKYQENLWDKKLPYELQNSKRIRIDETGRIELIEVKNES